MTIFTVTRRKAQVICHKGHFLLHLAYLSAATLEGHGTYSLFAGALGVFIIGGALIGEPEHD